MRQMGSGAVVLQVDGCVCLGVGNGACPGFAVFARVAVAGVIPCIGW